MVAVLERHARRIARRLVATDAVVEDRLRVGRNIDHPAEPVPGRRLRGALDQLRRPGLLAAPRREQHLLVPIPDSRLTRRLREYARLLEDHRDARKLS